jgi:hypothetical protein
VYDVGQGEANEDDVDNYCENEPFNLNIQDAHDIAVDNVEWVQDNVEEITIEN